MRVCATTSSGLGCCCSGGEGPSLWDPLQPAGTFQALFATAVQAVSVDSEKWLTKSGLDYAESSATIRARSR